MSSGRDAHIVSIISINGINSIKSINSGSEEEGEEAFCWGGFPKLEVRRGCDYRYTPRHMTVSSLVRPAVVGVVALYRSYLLDTESSTHFLYDY